MDFKFGEIIDKKDFYNANHAKVIMGLSAEYLYPNHTVNARLTSKYDIHFNFFLTKPVTEMVYNHTSAPATISFKDAVIFADNNEYLKRYYFLKNALDKDEIYDRINLLACTHFQIQSSMAMRSS